MRRLTLYLKALAQPPDVFLQAWSRLSVDFHNTFERGAALERRAMSLADFPRRFLDGGPGTLPIQEKVFGRGLIAQSYVL